MADTYHLRAGAQIMHNKALFAVRNTSAFGSGISIDVTSLDFYGTPSSATSSFDMNPITLNRVSAYSGGVDVSLSSVGARSGSTLPSGIKLINNPESITSGSPIRRLTQVRAMLSPTAPSGLFSPYINGGNPGELWRTTKGAMQGIELQEGEGVALLPSVSYGRLPQRLSSGVATLVFTDGTNTFCASAEVDAEGESSNIFLLFNTAGSGVVIKLVNAMFLMDAANIENLAGQSVVFSQPWIKIIPFRSYNGDQGVAVSANSADTNSPDISAYMDARCGKFSLPLDVSDAEGNENLLLTYPSGASTVAQVAMWKNVQSYGSRNYRNANGGPTESSAQITPLLGRMGMFGRINGNCKPIRLNPGEGVALVPIGQIHNTFFNVEATVSLNQSAAVYPAAGDVDSGVQYGPNATDYTGTLEQPAITDVLSGVQYGADGTEFTGTATGGGGGNTYSRGRVTNA